jgi:hypothetical protein
MHARMLSRVRQYFQGAKFARMSSGTYCVIRDLGLVKGGKGMRHHEVLITFSLRAVWRWMVGACRNALARKRAGWLEHIPEHMPENTPQAVAAPSALGRLPRQ